MSADLEKDTEKRTEKLVQWELKEQQSGYTGISRLPHQGGASMCGYGGGCLSDTPFGDRIIAQLTEPSNMIQGMLALAQDLGGQAEEARAQASYNANAALPIKSGHGPSRMHG